MPSVRSVMSFTVLCLKACLIAGSVFVHLLLYISDI